MDTEMDYENHGWGFPISHRRKKTSAQTISKYKMKEKECLHVINIYLSPVFKYKFVIVSSDSG